MVRLEYTRGVESFTDQVTRDDQSGMYQFIHQVSINDYEPGIRHLPLSGTTKPPSQIRTTY